METIINQVNEVLKHSQQLSCDIDSTSLIKQWSKAKEKFIKEYFQGQLTYTHPEKIAFNLNEKSQQERYASFIEYVVSVAHLYWDDDFVEYLQNIGYRNFYNNSLDGDFIVFGDKKIQKGTKVIKSFKYFVTDHTLLEDIQNKASEIIQENKIEGYLTFSVHPLDYLSISETTYNWRSCHALDGEYRGGNLSYMIDSSTVVCYLSNGNNAAKLPRFPETVLWNSKKWRCLLFFSDDRDVIFAGRQYPFFSPGALEKVREIFITEMNDPYNWFSHKWSYWHNDYLESFEYKEHVADGHIWDFEEERYCYIAGKILDLFKIVQDKKGSLQFNDLLRSSCYSKPFYMFKQNYFTGARTKLHIGGEVACLHCGEHSILDTNTVLCPHCNAEHGVDLDSDEYPTCPHCGNHFYWEDSEWIDDERVCLDCINNSNDFFQCETCGCWHYNSDKHYIKETETFVCNNCFFRYERNKEENENSITEGIDTLITLEEGE